MVVSSDMRNSPLWRKEGVKRHRGVGEWSLPVSPMKEDTCSIFYPKSNPFATLLRGELYMVHQAKHHNCYIALYNPRSSSCTSLELFLKLRSLQVF